MKLEWMAAVLRPHDIAPHPAFPDPDDSSTAHVALAAAVLGKPIGRNVLDEIMGVDSPQMSGADKAIIDAVIKTFGAATIREGASAIREFIDQPNLDLAVASALALIGACAFAELERFDACDELIRTVLEKLTGNDASIMFLKACLLQQQCLRKRDWAHDYYEENVTVVRILQDLSQEARFPDFVVSRAATGDSHSTMQHIILALRYSAWSLAPSDRSSGASRIFPTHEELVKFQWSEELLRIRDDLVDEYVRHIEDEFRSAYNDKSSYLGRSRPDLFYMNLRYELYGNANVYQTRRDLALLRLTIAASSGLATDYAECLRLLRYANADSDLDLAIQSLRLGGPLSALSRDARQVLASRLTPELVRYAELSVVRGAAELLTESEADDALAAIYRLVEAGSPTNVVGRWTAFSKRFELTWGTAAELANGTGKSSDAALRLLNTLRTADYETSIDMAYARVLRILDWKQTTPAVDALWRAWLTESGSVWTHTAGIARLKLGEPAQISDPFNPTLNEIALIANDAMKGNGLSEEIMAVCVSQVLRALHSLQRTSKNGPWGIGGIDAADVAAALALLGAIDLWEPLSEFLVSPTVPRAYRSAAFDRLAVDHADLDETTSGIFREHAYALLWSADPLPVDGERIIPYPAALRFLSSHRLIAEDDVFSAMTSLSGSRDLTWRIEAARTASAVAQHWPTEWLTSIAVQLSFDPSPDAKGYAAHALAVLAGDEGKAGRLGRRRLATLMESDGIIVPLLGVRGLARFASPTDLGIVEAVVRLAARHPSRRVRDEASQLRDKLQAERN